MPNNQSQQIVYTPAVAAQLITDPRTGETVNAHTLRRWCQQHSGYLSESANPSMNVPRQLTERDVEVLREVAKLRGEGIYTAAINDRLANMTFATIDNPEDQTVQLPATVPQENSEAPQLPALVADLLNQQITSVRDENAEIKRRVEMLETQSSNKGSALAYGVILGIGLAIVFAAVLSLMFG